jgi:hypothetical protein
MNLVRLGAWLAGEPLSPTHQPALTRLMAQPAGRDLGGIVVESEPSARQGPDVLSALLTTLERLLLRQSRVTSNANALHPRKSAEARKHTIEEPAPTPPQNSLALL